MNKQQLARRMMERARFEAQFATCDAAQVGCVIAVGDLVLATGYNGAPRGVPHCADVGCVIQHARSYLTQNEVNNRGESTYVQYQAGREYSRHVHAEANAICAAAYYGRMLKGATCYVTTPPCPDCTKLLIQAGVVEVIYDATDEQTRAFLDGGASELLFRSGLAACWIAGVPRF